MTDTPVPVSWISKDSLVVDSGLRKKPKVAPQLVEMSGDFRGFVVPAAQRLLVDRQMVDVSLSLTAKLEPLYGPTVHLPPGQAIPPVLLGTGEQEVGGPAASTDNGASIGTSDTGARSPDTATSTAFARSGGTAASPTPARTR